MNSPLLGTRRAVIDDITTALELAARGVGPRTLVLTAGPGSGKTHTLHHLAATVGFATRWASADELSWRQPYAVASALLGVEIPAPVPAGFDTTLDVAVDSLCAHGPHLLVIDDAHNADSGSLQFLDRLAAAAADLPLVLLLARRHLPARELVTRLLARPFVREWQLPPMDSADLEVLAHHVLGAWPDEQLSRLLNQSGGNPMHARALLEDLRGQGGVVIEGERAAIGDTVTTTALTSLHAVIAQQLALLDDTSRALVQKLAVWGGPATLGELAAIDHAPPSALVGAAQTVIDAGIIASSPTGAMEFTHDVYADVSYEGVDLALRGVLHTAIADHHDATGNRQLVAHHLLAAGAGDSAATAAVTRAHEELAHVPAVAVDLLDTAARQVPSAHSPTRTLELDLATALARSGQLARAAEVAEQGLPKATDIATIAGLHRTLLFTLIAQGKSTQVLELTAATMQLPIDPATRAALLDIGRYVGLLGGTAPIPPAPFTVTGPGTVNELVTEALRRFLSGDAASGLELSLEASRREGETDGGPQLSTSADIWPPFIELHVHGPAAAEALLKRATGLRTDRGAAWMTAYHDFTQGGIAMTRGRLDDAAATLNTGLERAAAAEMGWTSIAEGSRAMIDVFRGDFSSAARRLDRFFISGLPNQFGLPVPAHAQVLLLEAQRKLRPAAAAARQCWTHTTDLGLHGWLPSLAVDCARIAHRTDDAGFADAITTAISEIPFPVPAAGRGPIALARALCLGTPETIIPAAVSCARAAHEQGDMLTEVAAWEEAACAAAASGDKQTTRQCARSALLLTQHMGSSALGTRLTSRLRALGLRLDAGAVQMRPRTGWESLTRTEVTIAELIAGGLNGAEIADRLFISQRTVQTHVSHALTKLDLRTRVELAAFTVARRLTTTTPAPSTPPTANARPQISR
ncbi:LuxR C-terminal-related transcriptional regulator [Rhodococcus sp. (in: high G+C Gram-positive bacteria)]|uniref:LuxR C-terminal-related transcriptional regulator n=1 Tax=Rhodococcus sp. TaxID=1831 RepID=UPI00257EF5C7|nr:LuxR C-terminal-related transcriptional regulator [Rhodococcus sp. (in: high G+C Gram-positive bacteria)]MBQ7803960.1 helix-turn-helix transcriptional regulator [Rhodococcus sp. (in: high G+C Gram-positive bacteria)]